MADVDTATPPAGESTPPAAPTPPAGTETPPVATDPGNLLAWHSTLPEPLRTAPTVQQYKTLESAIQGLVEKDRLVGRSIQLPQKPFAEDPEAWGKVYEKLGRPADANAYEITLEGWPDGSEMLPERERAFKETAHAIGLTPYQVQELVKLQGRWQVEFNNEMAGAEARTELETRQALEREFGASTPRLLQYAQNFFELIGRGAFGGEGQEAWQAIVDAGLGNHPKVIKAFANAYTRLGEGDFFDDNGAPAGPSTIETMKSRAKVLSAKALDGGLTPEEQSEQTRLYSRIAEYNERSGRTALRGAPML